ncbi:SDR family NAD(P)-dependent oxidoreductase [soil metagenome]|jgi:NADP-dependent 3-hydroxy acid dehydrogenase YdfG
MKMPRTVLITGATSGIGRACAEAFHKAGSRVVAVGRRKDRLDELASDLGGDVHTIALDVRDGPAVEQAFAALPEEWRHIDLLLNNAGLAVGKEPLQAGEVSAWLQMVETNVIGLLQVTAQVLPAMVEKGSGHIINIGSIAGRETYPTGTVYCATKAAVDRITKGMRMDVLGSGVRVSTVDPGMVQTEFNTVRYRGDTDRADAHYEGVTPLSPEDVADAVTWAASRPAHVQIAEVLILPTDQAGAGKLARRS